MIDLNVLIDEPADTYHAKAKDHFRGFDCVQIFLKQKVFQAK